MNQEPEKFENWAIIEIMGHTKCAGLAKTVAFGNTVMLRIEIPETNKQPAHTKMYGMSSIFSISPVTEEIAKSHAEAWNLQPIQDYDIKRAYQKRFDEAVEIAVNKKLNPQLEASNSKHDDEDDDTESFDNDDYDGRPF